MFFKEVILVFCQNCNREADDESRFCPYCGAALMADSDNVHQDLLKEEKAENNNATIKSKEGYNSNLGYDDNKEYQPEVDNSKKPFNKKILFAGIGIAAFAAVLIAFIMLFGSSDLTEEQIISDLDQVQLDVNNSIVSEWGNNEGYQETSREVDQIEKTTRDSRIVSIKRIFQNDSFEITCCFEATYMLVDNTWTPHELFETSRSIQPVDGINDQSIIDNANSLISNVQDNDYKNADGRTVKLSDIYSADTNYTIIENNTSAEGGSVVLQGVKSSGLGHYKMNLTASFVWDGSDWKIETCSVDSGAYIKDYSSVVGKYVATFDHTEAINGGVSHCFGARKNPLIIDIKSYDSQGKTVTADLTFTVHNHLDPDNNADTVNGDGVYTATNVIIPLEETNGYQEIYYKDGANGIAEVTVYVQFSEDSANANAHIETSYWPEKGWDTYDDYFLIDFSKKQE